jgi:hypothetical protein
MADEDNRKQVKKYRELDENAIKESNSESSSDDYFSEKEEE